jgi:hypothetical protein
LSRTCHVVSANAASPSAARGGANIAPRAASTSRSSSRSSASSGSSAVATVGRPRNRRPPPHAQRSSAGATSAAADDDGIENSAIPMEIVRRPAQAPPGAPGARCLAWAWRVITTAAGDERTRDLITT